jgi:hypothetical protein
MWRPRVFLATTALNRSLFLRMGFEPQSAGGGDWIRRHFPPPNEFIAAAVDFAVMPPAQGDGELVADLASQSPTLGEAQMVGVRGLGAAPAALAGSFASRASKTACTRSASAAVSVFLSARHRRAQMVIESALPSALSSARSRSRNSADASGPRTGLAGLASLARRAWPPPFGRPLPFGLGFSSTEVRFVGVERSGASRSSSPAMPTGRRR